MKDIIILNFKNLSSELKNKILKLCILKNNIGSIAIEDMKGNLYMIENYYQGSYIDRLRKNGSIANFYIVDKNIQKNVKYEILEQEATL